MQCDFISVTDILMNNMKSSVTMHYNNLLNMLFGSYLANVHLYAFERPVTSKATLHISLSREQNMKKHSAKSQVHIEIFNFMFTGRTESD